MSAEALAVAGKSLRWLAWSCSCGATPASAGGVPITPIRCGGPIMADVKGHRPSPRDGLAFPPFPPILSTLTEVVMNTSRQVAEQAGLLRILVPINAKADSRWGVRYALRRALQGAPVEVILLNVGEIISQWQVLRFRTQQEIAQFQAQRAQAFIAEAGELLAAQNIAYRGLFRQGDIAFSIVDTAEELECDEIAMPRSRHGLATVFSRDLVAEVRRRQRAIPVVIVDGDGVPQ